MTRGDEFSPLCWICYIVIILLRNVTVSREDFFFSHYRCHKPAWTDRISTKSHLTARFVRLSWPRPVPGRVYQLAMAVTWATILVIVLVAVTKHSTRATSRSKEGFILVCSLRVQSIMGRKSWWQKWSNWPHFIHTQDTERDEWWHATFFFSFRDPSQGDGVTHSQSRICPFGSTFLGIKS